MKPLFSEGDLSDALHPQIDQMRQAIASTPHDEVPQAPEYWLDIYGAVPITLSEDAIKTNRPEEGVVTFIVPFTGTAELLKYRPKGSSRSHPEAEFGFDEIYFTYDMDQPRGQDRVKEAFQKDLELLKKWLDWSKREVDEFNQELVGVLDRSLADRKIELDTDDSLMKDLGYPEV